MCPFTRVPLWVRGSIIEGFSVRPRSGGPALRHPRLGRSPICFDRGRERRNRWVCGVVKCWLPPVFGLHVVLCVCVRFFFFFWGGRRQCNAKSGLYVGSVCEVRKGRPPLCLSFKRC